MDARNPDWPCRTTTLNVVMRVAVVTGFPNGPWLSGWIKSDITAPPPFVGLLPLGAPQHNDVTKEGSLDLQCVCVCVVWRARNPRGREINMISQPALKKFCLLVSVLHLSQLDPGFYITAGLLVWVPRVRWIQWSVKQIRILLRHDFKIWLASQIYQWCMFIQTHWDFSEKEKNILF